jgi:small conductance mechanosensitive channel
MANAEGILWGKLTYVYTSLIELLPNIVAGAVAFAIFFGGSFLADRAVTRAFHARHQYDLGHLLGGFTRWALVFLGFLVAATIIFPSVKPSDVLGALGVGSVAIGFAFKDILQNWFAGLLLLLREPFKRGDQIVIQSYEGTVEHIQARATTIKTYDGRRVVIPNSEIYTQPVTVNTAYPIVRSSYDVGIGYGDDIEAARDVILDALDGLDGIAHDPRPEVIPWDLSGSSVNLRVRWWTESPRIKVVLARGRVIAAVRDALTKAQIDMPYPTQVMLFHDQTEESDGDRRRQREGWPAGDSPPRARAVVENEARAVRPQHPRPDTISSEGELAPELEPTRPD